MAGFKLTTLNAEWLEHSAGVDLGWLAPGQSVFPGKAPTLAEAKARLDGLSTLIAEIDPDVLFICEGVVGAAHMRACVAKHLPAYELVTHPVDDDDLYRIQGPQWLWFLVRKDLLATLSPRLLSVETWMAYVADESRGSHAGGEWVVSIPKVQGDVLLPNVRERHGHYRHPQVLVLDWGGTRVEIIGVHLKSKLVTKKPRKRRPGEEFEAYAKQTTVARYLAESHIARIKLTTEATNVRYYIDRRFEQEPEPSIFLVGDVNDGPGKELIEREYLFHDLIGNLQGDIFLAERFLNHALFDFPTHLRWTVQFDDLLDPERPDEILLDHILFTQALAGGGSGPLRVPPHGGLVEHEVHERISSLHPGSLSDHRPVSVHVIER
jgi:hypothetical protein